MNIRTGSAFIAVIALMLAVSGAMAAGDAVTVTYREGVHGYTGTRDTGIAKHIPNENTGANRHMLAGYGVSADVSWKGLVKFTGLQIPKGGRIVSARLSVYCDRFSGRPNVTVYGLLKDFVEGSTREGDAKPGETTWFNLRHGQEKWSQPGAGQASDTFKYDADADYYSMPEDPMNSEGQGRYSFDVTSTFRNQFENAKEYGWVLVVTDGSPNRQLGFLTRHAPPDNRQVPVNPELTVTYTPPSGAKPVSSEIGPRLINFYLGDPRDVRRYMDRVNKFPFDGAVFDAQDNRRLGGGDGWLNLCTFGPDKLDYETFSRFREAMKFIQQPPSPLQYNFLRICALPGTLQKRDGLYSWETRARYNDKVTMWWSDNFDSVVHNWKLAARMARDCGMRGILFDWEQYGGDFFNYEKLQDAKDKGKSLEETKAQVRKCAEQVMKAVNEEYPDITLIIIIDTYSKHAPNLWTSFMDGLVCAADTRTRIVDGNEKYDLTSLKEFKDAYDADYADAKAMSAVPDKYLKQAEVGFGVWLERTGWGPNPEVQNVSPASLQTLLENALLFADTYVWVFSGEGAEFAADWLTGKNLPDSYLEASRKARELARRRRGFEP